MENSNLEISRWTFGYNQTALVDVVKVVVAVVVSVVAMVVVEEHVGPGSIQCDDPRVRRVTGCRVRVSHHLAAHADNHGGQKSYANINSNVEFIDV